MFLSNILSYATPTWQHMAIYKAPLLINTYRLQDKEKKGYKAFCAQSFHEAVKLPFQTFPICTFFEKSVSWLPLSQSHFHLNYFFQIKNIVHFQYRNLVSKENAKDTLCGLLCLGLFLSQEKTSIRAVSSTTQYQRGFYPEWIQMYAEFQWLPSSTNKQLLKRNFKNQRKYSTRVP